MTRTRSVDRVIAAMPTSDGARVNLKRSIGSPMLDHLDPFLLLDNIESDSASDYIAGFPEHPHRGFETVTYMVEGRMRHRDSTGGEGLLESGSAQWMTAGRGVIHSEMPEQEDGRLHGFQLWVNLPTARKMIPPRYQDIAPEDIPEVALPGGGRLRVVAGSAHGVTGPISGIDSEPLFLDLSLGDGEATTLAVPEGHNAFAYVFAGTATIAETAIPADNLAVLGDGDSVDIAGPGRLLLVAGQPIGEPVARHGPFVMNTRDE
ncbi:MAG: pirin family protein, partial [Alphaproteobacteria bacterium]|nr:pirin family protein [Alphaproteobacteria bacterium]